MMEETYYPLTKTYTIGKWKKFKKSYPLLEEKLDEAIVKEIEDYQVLIHIPTLEAILDTCHM